MSNSTVRFEHNVQNHELRAHTHTQQLGDGHVPAFPPPFVPILLKEARKQVVLHVDSYHTHEKNCVHYVCRWGYLCMLGEMELRCGYLEYIDTPAERAKPGRLPPGGVCPMNQPVAHRFGVLEAAAQKESWQATGVLPSETQPELAKSPAHRFIPPLSGC